MRCLFNDHLDNEVINSAIDNTVLLANKVEVKLDKGSLFIDIDKQNAIMTTSAMRGVFFDKSEARSELMQLIQNPPLAR